MTTSDLTLWTWIWVVASWLAGGYNLYVALWRHPRVERKLRRELAARVPVLNLPCLRCGRVGLQVGVEADAQSVSFLCPICHEGPILHLRPVPAEHAEPPLPESDAVRQARQVVEGMALDE